MRQTTALCPVGTQPTRTARGGRITHGAARAMLAIALFTLLAACATDQGVAGGGGTDDRAVGALAPRPAAIHHLVFVGLVDPADRDAIIADSDTLLGTISSVTYYFCGPHHESGRATIGRDYDIALGVGFDDDEGYRIYLEHPDHVEFVRRWLPRSEWIRIHDVADATRQVR